ncbi:hypothetical protein J2W17_005843, partial [Pseudomonas lini]|uniref:hypothetical protein n=1 Tax=Pseudomonas lini TaxID=163011 RepID=UPI00277FE022
HNLNLSNRPVRTRMPGGVAGVRSMKTVPYADCPCRSRLAGEPDGAVNQMRRFSRKIWLTLQSTKNAAAG